MNERLADIAIVGLFVVCLAMMASISWSGGLEVACGVIVVVGIAMSGQRGKGPFEPEVRRRLRSLVLAVAAVAAVALSCSRIGSSIGCVVWPALFILTGLTYLSLRIRLFGSAPRDSGEIMGDDVQQRECLAKSLVIGMRPAELRDKVMCVASEDAAAALGMARWILSPWFQRDLQHEAVDDRRKGRCGRS